jgi:hypothetical protein
MEDFDIKVWHVVTFFITILLGIFKNEIKNTVLSILQLEEKKFPKGLEIQILNPSGIWINVTIVNYRKEIPFFKRAGVVVIHKDDNGEEYQEFIASDNWKQLRKRSK